MDAVIGTMYPERWWDDAYVERRVGAVHRPGAWQCIAAERLNAPWHTGEPSPLADDDYVAYERIDRPVLLVAGAADKLRRLDDFHDRAERIPSCTTKVFDERRACPAHPVRRGVQRARAPVLEERLTWVRSSGPTRITGARCPPGGP